MNESGLWQYRARLVRIIDGDTLVIEADVGFNARVEVTIRIAGIDAPELGTVDGIDAKQFLQNEVLPYGGGWSILVQTHKTRTGRDTMSFARYVADVWLLDGTNVAALMIEAGHARKVDP